jgi:hypothetical protein
VVQAGDLFDNDRDWYILAEIAEALCEHRDVVRVYTVPGQHDKYYRTRQKATNLGVLEKAGLITVLTREPLFTRAFDLDSGIVALYGAGWGDELVRPHDLPQAVSAQVLVAHAPIAPSGVYPGHEVTKPINMAALGYDIVLCGDVHRQYHIVEGGRDVINTGPVFRHRMEEYSFTHKPSVCLFINKTGASHLEWHEIPHEAADVVLSREHITTGTENRDNMRQFTAKLKGRPTGNRTTVRERVMVKLQQGRYNPATLEILKEVMEKDDKC